MINAIYTMSRMQLGYSINDKNAKGSGRNLLISINTQPDGLLISEPQHHTRLRELGYVDCLSLAFGDVTFDEVMNYRFSGRNEAPGFKLFSYDDARAIVAFIDKYKHGNFDRLLIHCDMGKSRSGATAYWAWKYLSNDNLCPWPESKFSSSNKTISPNTYVAKVLCEVSGIPYTKEEFDF